MPFDDEPRDARRSFVFRRHATPLPRPGLWAGLFGRQRRAYPPPPMFEDYHEWAEQLLAELGTHFAASGWAWTTGPWAFYEPDYRIEATVAGQRVVLILVAPGEEGRDGFLTCDERADAPLPEAVSGAVLAVVRDLLQRRAEVHGLREYATFRDTFEETRAAASR